MIFFKEDNVGQLEALKSLRELEEGKRYFVADIIKGKTFIESREVKYRKVNTICNRDGSATLAYRTNDNYRDMNPEQLSHVHLQLNHVIIFVRRFTDDKQDPYVFICHVETIHNTQDATIKVKRIQRYEERHVNEFGKYSEVVQFAVEKQLDSDGVPSHFSFNKGKEVQDCLFIRKGDSMYSYTKDGRILLLSSKSMLQRAYKGRGYLPSMAILRISFNKYKKYNGPIICDGYQYNYVLKDEWMDNWKGIEKSLGSVETMRYVTTVNGDTILAFVSDSGIIQPIIRTGKGYELIELNSHQSKELIKNISQAYFGSIGSVFV